HGDTDTDSHKTLPSISFSKQRIDSIELYPFRKLIDKGMESVMIAHLNIPSLELRQNIPSSLSYPIVKELLQEEMGFNGLIFTDALNMKGASNYKNPGEVDVAAFLAGNDVLLISEDVPKAHRLLMEAYEKKQITEERLAHSVKKILYTKYKVGLHQYTPIQTQFLYEELNTAQDDALYEELMENAMTVVKNNDNLIPIKDIENQKIAYVNFGDDSGEPFFKQLNKYTKVDWVKAAHLDALILQLEKYDLVILGFHKSNDNPWKSYKMTEREMVWMYEISRTNNVILSVFTRPYALLDLKTTANFESILIAYQNSKIGQEIAAQTIFGARAAKGKLPVSVGTDFPMNTKIMTPALSRLQYGTPESVGLNSQRLKKVDELAQSVVDKAMAPGAQVLVAKDGKVVFEKSYGYHTPDKKIAVENDHLYDLASLTKILASVPLLMDLVENNEISLESKLGDLLPEYKNSNKANIPLKRLLSHYAGFKAWIPFYTNTLDKSTKKPSAQYYRDTPDTLFTKVVTEKLYMRRDLEDSIQQIILESELSRPVKYLYSDLPYYILKKYFEDHYKEPMEQLVQNKFYEALGANTLTYLPTLRFPLNKITPTEDDKDFRHQIIHGFVHDQGAAMMGGVGGHAGLFGNANDVAKVMQLYLQNGFYGGKRYFKPETVEAFNTCYYCENDVRRGVGFDKPQLKDVGPTCGCVSMTSFGHSGFTGTYTWADPETGIVYVFLSNRTYPSSSNRKLISSNIRTEIQQAIVDAIDF
ncbi:MAG TPA: serine hydrolase, partial [Flavobacteriaceae bacterium]|nr:serine hydrolase [Flavobacteriaceae bacterium]